MISSIDVGKNKPHDNLDREILYDPRYYGTVYDLRHYNEVHVVTHVIDSNCIRYKFVRVNAVFDLLSCCL